MKRRAASAQPSLMLRENMCFWRFPSGTYTEELEVAGFKKCVRKSVTFELNQILTLDFGLQLSGATDVIEVSGAPPLVDTTSKQPGAAVNAPFELLLSLSIAGIASAARHESRLSRGSIPVRHRGPAMCPRYQDRKSTRLNSSHPSISYAVFCLKKKKKHFN